VNKKISVLMTGPLLTDLPGGILTHVQNFIGAFSTSSSINFRFFSVTLGLYDREGWATKAWRFAGSLLPFGRAVRAVDAVHINSTFDNRSLIRDGVYLLIARRLLGKPVLLQFHGGLPKQVGLLRSALAVRLFGAVLGCASRVLILSRIQGAEFSQLFPRVHYDLVPNYIDCGQGTTPVSAAPHAPIRFLFMGRLHENKGIKEIVSASRILAGKGYGFIVEFCGDGPLKAWLENEVAGPTVAHPYLSYTGVAYGEKKEAALVRADVMLLPSSHPEGFPYALLEAFKFGMPMIASPVGAIPDVIVSGKNGLLVPARDAVALATQMEFAIRNPAAIQAMGTCARQQVEAEFSIEKLRLTFEGLYTTIAGVQ
jgi:glycosyltransferase involved in cell wall biosynthesis